MRVSIEFDTKDPTGATISFDGEKQGYLSRVDLKLKLKGLNYMTIERYVGKGKEAKKFKEQIFRYDTNPAPTVPSDFIPGNLELARLQRLAGIWNGLVASQETLV